MRFAIVALMALAFLHLSIDAASSESERASLRELPGVIVVIGGVKPDAEADGLSEDSIRSAVELILRSSGIRIFEPPERLAELPFLYVRVSTFKAVKGLYAASVKVETPPMVGPTRMVRVWGNMAAVLVRTNRRQPYTTAHRLC